MDNWIEYTISGQGGNPADFLTLGFAGKQNLDFKGSWFYITNRFKNNSVFKSDEDLEVLKQSLKDGIDRCGCSRVSVEVSLHIK